MQILALILYMLGFLMAFVGLDNARSKDNIDVSEEEIQAHMSKGQDRDMIRLQLMREKAQQMQMVRLIPKPYNLGLIMVMVSSLFEIIYIVLYSTDYYTALDPYVPIAASLMVVGGFLMFVGSMFIAVMDKNEIRYRGETYPINSLYSVEPEGWRVKVRTQNGVFYLSWIHTNLDKLESVVNDVHKV